MDSIYIVTRPNGKKVAYDWARRLEKEEGFKSGEIKNECVFPVKIGGFTIDRVDHDQRI